MNEYLWLSGLVDGQTDKQVGVNMTDDAKKTRHVGFGANPKML